MQELADKSLERIEEADNVDNEESLSPEFRMKI
jgi:hypothetical protein